MYILPIKNQLGVQKLLIQYFDFYPNSSYTLLHQSIDESITVQLSKLYFITKTDGNYFKDMPLNGQYLAVRNYL